MRPFRKGDLVQTSSGDWYEVVDYAQAINPLDSMVATTEDCCIYTLHIIASVRGSNSREHAPLGCGREAAQ
jgi:hypothetical protein